MGPAPAETPADTQTRRNWRRMVREFAGESARGAALVAAAMLDLNLEDLLRACLIDDPAEVEYLLGTSIQSYGSRIRLSYALGLISEDESNDLHIVKTVRNYFAHNLHVTFEAAEVKSQVAQLRLLRRLVPDADQLSPRRQLEQTACMLSVLLVRRVAEVAERRCLRHPEPDVSALADHCSLLNAGADLTDWQP